MPFPHAFIHPQYAGDTCEWTNPKLGQIGIESPELAYSRGATPLGFRFANFRPCGSPAEFLNGSDIDNPGANLIWTPLGFSTCCLRWFTDYSALEDFALAGELNLSYLKSPIFDGDFEISGEISLSHESVILPDETMILSGDVDLTFIRPGFPQGTVLVDGDISLEYEPHSGWPEQVLVQFNVDDNNCDCSPYRDGFYLNLTIDSPTNPYWEAINPLGPGGFCGVTVYLTVNTLAPHCALSCNDAVVYSDDVSWDGVSNLTLTTRAGGPSGFACTNYPASVTLVPA